MLSVGSMNLEAEAACFLTGQKARATRPMVVVVAVIP